MDIIIEPHTLIRAEERGTNRNEITDILLNGYQIPAKKGRFCKYKVYPFQQIRNNKYYQEKRVEVIYIIENNKIITITTYCYYGLWEIKDEN